MALPTRKLGRQGLETSAIGLGCMSLTPAGGFYDAEDLTEEQAVAVLHRAVELGITLFNTSDLYGPFTNEELLGRALEGHKERVRISTKWGPMFAVGGGLRMDASPANCRACCEGSLRRLGVPCLDLFTMRGPVDPHVPLEETMGEVKKLIEEGKVRRVGLSEVSAADIRRAHAVVPISAVEQEWSLFTRDIELGIGVLAYSPLGRGMLAGRFKSAGEIGAADFRRHHMPRFQGENFDKNLALAENVFRMAEKKGCTPGQLALAWLLHKGEDVVPIPGTKSLKYLEENARALNVRLTPQEMEELEQAVPHDQVAGTRYADMQHGTYHGSGKQGIRADMCFSEAFYKMMGQRGRLAGDSRSASPSLCGWRTAQPPVSQEHAVLGGGCVCVWGGGAIWTADGMPIFVVMPPRHVKCPSKPREE